MEAGRKIQEKRLKGKVLLDLLAESHLQEAVDFLEFLREKEEAERPIGIILNELHNEVREKGVPEMSAEADYIVTGDHHLLDLGAYKHMKILKVREFAVILRDIQMRRGDVV